MIVGIGTDIIEIARIDQMQAKFPDAFAKRLLTATELSELAQSQHPERFLAKRWALKEAVSKALGTGIAKGVSFTDMQIGHTELGAPTLHLNGISLQRAQQLGITDWQISVSDEQHYCVAFAIAQAVPKT